MREATLYEKECASMLGRTFESGLIEDTFARAALRSGRIPFTIISWKGDPFRDAAKISHLLVGFRVLHCRRACDSSSHESASFEGSEGVEIRTAHGGALGPVLNEKET